MFLSHLSLTHFRNYRSLELDFQRPLTLFQGQNAHGKSNLLEAIYYLATSKSVHAGAEREVVGWTFDEAPVPHCRIGATIRSVSPESNTYHASEKPLELEILLTPRPQSNTFQKQIKINGVSRRALDLVGKMRAVLFLPEDIKLVAGSPSERRRYLDVALCQLDREYTRALSRFQKVLTQRNGLLKSLRERGAGTSLSSAESQLVFWDDQLVDYGSRIIARRCHLIAQLMPLAHRCHFQLSNEREQLKLVYVPSINPGYLTETEHAQLRSGTEQAYRAQDMPIDQGMPNEDKIEISDDALRDRLQAVTEEEVTHVYRQKIEKRRSREIGAGITLYGPHRDELVFVANGRDLRTYGSRGQQRSAALSLKLAEVEAMTEITGISPILLLDDVMSELDAQRRGMLLSTLVGIKQAVVTTTDWEDFNPAFLHKAERFSVWEGSVERAG